MLQTFTSELFIADRFKQPSYDDGIPLVFGILGDFVLWGLSSDWLYSLFLIFGIFFFTYL